MTDEPVLLIACPFRPCQARVELVHVRALSLDQPAYNMIRQHQVEPSTWYGTCPASLMTHPLMPHEETLLAEQDGAYRAMLASYAPPERTESPADPEPERPPGFWRNSVAPPGGGTPGYTGRPILTLIQPNDPPPGPPAAPRTTQGGGAMASVAEIRGALNAANTSIAEGQAATQAALQRFTDARVQLTAVQGMTSRELSIPEIDHMVEMLEGVMSASTNAIEVNATFGASL